MASDSSFSGESLVKPFEGLEHFTREGTKHTWRSKIFYPSYSIIEPPSSGDPVQLSDGDWDI